jgi:hypothetical protein
MARRLEQQCSSAASPWIRRQIRCKEPEMKEQPITPGQKQGKTAVIQSQSGIATALLIAIVTVIVIFVAAGVYAVKNRHIWLAHGITAAMNAVIKNSALPSQEKSEVIEIIYRINQDYLNGKITASELGLIFEGMAKCPALTIGIIIQFEQSYVASSGLSDKEKSAANTELNRLARGLSSGMLGWEITETILAQISYPGDDGRHHLKAPGEVSDADIRQVIATIRDAGDDAGISQAKIEIDISDEFEKSVEKALGRSLS